MPHSGSGHRQARALPFMPAREAIIGFFISLLVSHFIVRILRLS